MEYHIILRARLFSKDELYIDRHKKRYYVDYIVPQKINV